MRNITLKRHILVGMLAGLIGVGISAQAETVLRFGYETPQTDSQHIAAKHFNELLKERSKGEISLKLFSDSTLGNAPAMISGVRGGTIDMEMSGSNNFTGLVPRLNVLDIPFLFRSKEHAYKVLDGEIGDQLLKDLEPLGLKGLAYWENGWRDVTNSRNAVRVPADLKGLKIRTSASPMNIEAFKLLGANPIPMPFAEVYTALETRTIDAQEHPINVTWSAKFYEVQKHLSLTHHAYSPLILVMNKKKFDALSPDLQKVLVDAARESGDYQRQLVAENEAKILDGLRKAAIEVVEDVDQDAFRAALGDHVRNMFADKNEGGAALLKAIDETK